MNSQFSPSASSSFYDEDDFSIDNILNSVTSVFPPFNNLVPNLESSQSSPPTSSDTSSPTSPPSPPESFDTQSATAVSDYSGIIMSEIKRAQTSMENVALLSQLQQQGFTTLPNALVVIPDLLITECNDAFAKLLEYSCAQELINARVTMLDIVFPQLKALLQRRAHKFMARRDAKIVRTAIMQTKIGTAKCCTLVVKPNGNDCRLTILRHANGVSERAARKLECITALNTAKRKVEEC